MDVQTPSATGVDLYGVARPIRRRRSRKSMRSGADPSLSAISTLAYTSLRGIRGAAARAAVLCDAQLQQAIAKQRVQCSLVYLLRVSLIRATA